MWLPQAMCASRGSFMDRDSMTRSLLAQSGKLEQRRSDVGSEEKSCNEKHDLGNCRNQDHVHDIPKRLRLLVGRLLVTQVVLCSLEILSLTPQTVLWVRHNEGGMSFR